jgi:hypothetical protein
LDVGDRWRAVEAERWVEAGHVFCRASDLGFGSRPVGSGDEFTWASLYGMIVGIIYVMLNFG